MPFLCVECLSKIDHLNDPPIDDQLHLSILSHLRNGSTPSSNEHIDAFLADAPDNVSAYDEAIAETETLLSSLRSARSNLQLRIDKAQSLNSAPIRKLPPEILNEIFTLYCWEDSPSDRYILELANFIFFPTLELSWVCSSWRTSLRSRPDLWSSMRVSHQELQSPGLYQIFLIYITYSGGNMLDFQYDVNIQYLYGPRADDVMAILLNNSKRWRRATLHISQYDEGFVSEAQIWFVDFVAVLGRMNATGSSSQLEGNFPALEYAHIQSHYRDPWPAAFLNFLQTFSPCPRLHTLLLDDFTWAGHNIDLSHITNLSLETFSGRSLGHLLYRLPLLKTLSVSSFRLPEDKLSEDRAGDILLQQKGYHSSMLSKLDISVRTFRDMEAWTFLRLPCLTDLEIGNVVWWDLAYFITPFSSMLLQSECKLQTLDLPYKSCLVELLDSIALNLSESIINLTLYFQTCDDINSFTEVGPLRLREDGSRLFPNLRCLRLDLFWISPLDDDYAVCVNHIGNLLNSRIIAEHLEPFGLQTVTIRSQVPMNIQAQFMTCFNTQIADLWRLNVEFV